MEAGHSGHVILLLVHGHAEEVYNIDKGHAINQSMIFILLILPFIYLSAQSFAIKSTIYSFIHSCVYLVLHPLKNFFNYYFNFSTLFSTSQISDFFRVFN